jgi:ferredoxin
MPKVTITNEKKDIEVPAGANLREALRREGIEVYPGLSRYLNCMGNGMCGECRVLVKKGAENLSPKGLFERGKLFVMLTAVGHESEMRLSCKCAVNGDCTIETTPEMNLSGETFWQKPYPNK